MKIELSENSARILIKHLNKLTEERLHACSSAEDIKELIDMAKATGELEGAVRAVTDEVARNG